jgi:hypothetical protein
MKSERKIGANFCQHGEQPGKKYGSVFWDMTLWSHLKANRRFCWPPAFVLISCLAYS